MNASSPSVPTRAAAAAPAAPAIDDRGMLRGSIGMAVIALAGFGFLYSLAGVGLGQALFSDAANGSIVRQGERVVGSALVAQPFAGERYFQPRPSAAGYDPMALAGSNQARTNPDMRKRLDETRAAIAQREGVDPASVPGDLVTQSGGGIDPHISPESATLQAARVARARGMDRSAVDAVVARHTEAPQLGLLGQPRVNVLALNLALDAVAATGAPATTPAR